MSLVDELEDSGNFDFGPDGGTGVLSFFVLQAASHEEAVDAALADPRAAENINGYLRGKVAVAFKGGNYYAVTIDYQRGIPSQAAPNAGGSPAGQQTPGQEPNNQLSRDVSFSTGGATKRIYKSIRTRAGYGREGGTAPNFGKLIGVDIDGGKVEGTEVLAASSDFVVTRRYSYLSVGWFRYMLSCVSATNDAPFLGLDIGEVQFRGADGQFKDDDKTGFPWTVTGRFGFSPNKTIEEHEDELTLGPDDDETKQIRLTSVRGFEYVWVIYQKEKQIATVNGVARDYIVSRPLFAYVEVVVPEKDLSQLGFS